MIQTLRRLIAPISLVVATVFTPAITQQAQDSEQMLCCWNWQIQRAGQTKHKRDKATHPTDSTATTPARGQPTRRADRRGGYRASVTIVGPVSQAALPAAAIQTIRNSLPLLRTVKVVGNVITPLSGYSMWKLSNGITAVIGTEAIEPEAYGAWEKKLPLSSDQYSVVWFVCYCSGRQQDDACKFAKNLDGSVNPSSCSNAGCCQVKTFYIDENGMGGIVH